MKMSSSIITAIKDDAKIWFCLLSQKEFGSRYEQCPETINTLLTQFGHVVSILNGDDAWLFAVLLE